MITTIILKNEFIRSLKNKPKIVLNLLIPVICIILSTVINYISEPNMKINVVGKENISSENFIKEGNKIKGITIERGDSDYIKTNVILGNYEFVIDFINNEKVNVISNDKSIKNYISTGEISELKAYLSSKTDNKISLKDRTLSLMFIILSISSVLFSCNLIKDKDEGLLRRFILASNKYSGYVLGIYLFNLLFQIIIITVSTLIIGILPISLDMSIISFYFCELVVGLVCSTLGIFTASICLSELSASSFISSITVILSILGGAFLPLEKMPDELVNISDFILVKWIMDINYLNLIYILILIVVLLVLSLKISRRKFL